MSIHQYDKEVFTHGGQTIVSDFEVEIMAAQAEIKAVHGLLVVVGYHGGDVGEWHHDFTAQDDTDTARIGLLFKQAKLVTIRQPGMPDKDIEKAVKAGKVFFTWCDSDTKVKTVMSKAGGMPKKVKDFK